MLEVWWSWDCVNGKVTTFAPDAADQVLTLQEDGTLQDLQGNWFAGNENACASVSINLGTVDLISTNNASNAVLMATSCHRRSTPPATELGSERCTASG